MEAEYLKSSVHTHTVFCDGKNTPQEMARCALENGLRTIGLSGHSHTPCDPDYCMTPEKTKLYREQCSALKAEYAGRLDVLCGLEWDRFSDDDPHAYDYWIGSVHYVQGPKTGKYYPIDWRDADMQQLIAEFDGDGLAAAEQYFALVAQTAEKAPTILGHFDVFKKTNADSRFFDEDASRYLEAGIRALRTAAAHGCVLEVNTGGVYRGYRSDYYPGDAFLREWLRLSGRVVITSDAHELNAMTFGFRDAAAHLRELGYTHVQVLGANGFERCEI